MKKRQKKERVVDITINILLVIIAIISIYPIWYVLIASVSSPLAIAKGEVWFLPVDTSFAAYKKLFDDPLIWKGYFNSIWYSIAHTVLSLVVIIPCAYALSRKSLPGRPFFSTLFIITMYFSGGLIPSFMVVNSLGLLDTPWAVIVPGCFSAYNMILAKSFFVNNVPDSLYDAARIDGCSYTRFFFQIVLPLSPAIIAIIALFTMTAIWNSYLPAQMYLYSTDLQTLQQIIKGITSTIPSTLAESMNTEVLADILFEKSLMKYAVVVVGCLPLVIMYPFIQKFFVGGIMLGAVKE